MCAMGVFQRVLIGELHDILFILIMVVLCADPRGLIDSIVTYHFEPSPLGLDVVDLAVKLLLVGFYGILLISKPSKAAFPLLDGLVQIH